jgi:hypothetical protein
VLHVRASNLFAEVDEKDEAPVPSPRRKGAAVKFAAMLDDSHRAQLEQLPDDTLCDHFI